MKVKPIEELLNEKVKQISKIDKIAFLVTVIGAIIVLFPAISLRLQSSDGIISDPFSNWYFEVQLGRWMLPLLGYLRNWLTLSYYICAVGIVIMGFISVLLCRVFKVKRELFAAIIAVLIATFPSFSNSMQVFFYVEAYFLSIFFALLGFAFSMKKHGVLPGMCAFCISLGCYQMGLATAATFCIFIIVTCILDQVDWKQIRIIVVKMLITGILGGVAYLIVLQVVSRILNIDLQMARYSGMEALKDWRIWPQLLANTYKTTESFFFSSSGFNNGSWGFHVFNITLLGAGIICLGMKAKKVGPVRATVAVAFILLLPITMALLVIIYPGRSLDWLQTFPFILPLIFSIALVSEATQMQEKKVLCICAQYFAVIATLLLVGSYWKYNTANFLAMELTQNKTEALAQRLVGDMEDTAGYIPGMKVLVCGTTHPDNYPPIFIPLYDMTSRSSNMNGMVWADASLGHAGWNSILSRFTGIEYQRCGEEEIRRIIASEEYQEIPLYPDRQSLKVIDGIMVIKLNSFYDNLSG